LTTDVVLKKVFQINVTVPWAEIGKSRLCKEPISLLNLLPCPLGKQIKAVITVETRDKASFVHSNMQVS